MSDMSTSKQLTGDMLSPTATHTEVPLGKPTDSIAELGNSVA